MLMPLNQSKEMKDTRLHLGKQASEIESVNRQ